jgi:hypothetical protein
LKKRTKKLFITESGTRRVERKKSF